MSTDQASMSRRRALLTDRERELIGTETSDLGEKEREYRYQAASRIRHKIDELGDDVEILKEYHPQLLQELRAEVCPDEQVGDGE